MSRRFMQMMFIVVGDIRLRTIVNFFTILRWSLKLDWEFLFTVPGIPASERIRIIFCKYLFYMRDFFRPAIKPRHAITLGMHYWYNDRFGIGSIQRVFCSSWKLKEILPSRPVVVDVGANLGQFNLFPPTYQECRTLR